ncbi:TetR family transcriptional regulator [Dactylosporangium matsuzakiense]|uniref:TetR family transcriptional regulator n=1 Tax=Dactylosporangium matsuzakiense TaxID=53360 RepID=A0A9W6NNW2_9ACTN|nr:TetR family transcriptional regulator [Dactylosporangium matsuzakiense]
MTPAVPDSAPETSRGEQTRKLIVDTAVRLFRDQGYDRTTMRGIAQEAGVSVGNAYYYFPSKDHLVQQFYATVQEDAAAASAERLAQPGPFDERLRVALTAMFDVMTPYHAFAGKFIKTAVEPGSALSPFSAESAPARERSITVLRSVVEGATTKIDAELRADLPELLWLAEMGITLYWVHDTSPGQAKTRLLIDRAVPLVDRLVGLARVPGFKSVTREALKLYRLLR